MIHYIPENSYSMIENLASYFQESRGDSAGSSDDSTDFLKLSHPLLKMEERFSIQHNVPFPSFGKTFSEHDERRDSIIAALLPFFKSEMARHILLWEILEIMKGHSVLVNRYCARYYAWARDGSWIMNIQFTSLSSKIKTVLTERKNSINCLVKSVKISLLALSYFSSLCIHRSDVRIDFA